jgi:hypothetical protein
MAWKFVKGEIAKAIAFYLNDAKKPPFTMMEMIVMACTFSPTAATEKEIFGFIVQHFAYYRELALELSFVNCTNSQKDQTVDRKSYEALIPSVTRYFRASTSQSSRFAVAVMWDFQRTDTT